MKIIIILLIFLTFSCSSEKVYKVGILVGVEENIPVAESFKKEMETLGYIDKENISYDIKVGKSDTKLMKEICTEFVNNKVDLILSITHGATMTAKKATEGTGIPVVFSYAITNRGDLVKSIAEPGGNITGVRYPIPDLAIKRFEFLMEINPQIKNILLPHKRDYPPAMIVINGLQDVAEENSVELLVKPFDTIDEMEMYFKMISLNEEKIDSILILPEPFIYSDRGWEIVRNYSYNFNVPIAANSNQMVKNGALFSYTNIDEEMGELAAPLVHKIFSGIDVGTIPVITPKVYLHLNRTRAKELGLFFADSMIKLAVEIYE